MVNSHCKAECRYVILKTNRSWKKEVRIWRGVFPSGYLFILASVFYFNEVFMRLSKEQVEKISRIVLDNLKAKGLIVFKVPEDAVFHRMVEIFLKDIKAEDDLDREVEEILKGHAREIEAGRMDYRKMFNLTKTKLVKERGIVL